MQFAWSFARTLLFFHAACTLLHVPTASALNNLIAYLLDHFAKAFQARPV
jgi:hypothetical protein